MPSAPAAPRCWRGRSLGFSLGFAKRPRRGRAWWAPALPHPLRQHRPFPYPLVASSPPPTGAVKGLVDAVRGAQKEKAVRVGLLALKNLLDDDKLVCMCMYICLYMYVRMYVCMCVSAWPPGPEELAGRRQAGVGLWMCVCVCVSCFECCSQRTPKPYKAATSYPRRPFAASTLNRPPTPPPPPPPSAGPGRRHGRRRTAQGGGAAQPAGKQGGGGGGAAAGLGARVGCDCVRGARAGQPAGGIQDQGRLPWGALAHNRVRHTPAPPTHPSPTHPPFTHPPTHPA